MKSIKAGEFTLTEVEKHVWEMKQEGKMNVPGRIYGDEDIINHLIQDVKEGKDWNALVQIRNVACLPGMQKASLAMSDVHPGYGFSIGGVGAFDQKEGVFSVGGVGFDAGCNVANIVIPLKKKDIEAKKKELAEALFKDVPAGLGKRGKISVSVDELDEVLSSGAKFAVKLGYGTKNDLRFFEKGGCLEGANPKDVSATAKAREKKQIGTVGSGNHYLEVQYVEEIFDEAAAKAYGINKEGIIVSIHCGSRALGHQVGTDFLKILDEASRKYNIPIMDRELVCAPIQSEEGQKFFSAMKCAINYAYANKMVLIHLTREVFSKVFGIEYSEMPLLYCISHNSVMEEKHGRKTLIVHRKGATRAFGPGSEDLPKEYAKIGQPVLIGGTMGTCSYILKGTEKAMKETFASSCHGAGRAMSRNQAIRTWRGEDLIKELNKNGIIVKGHDWRGVAEEAPGAYKDVNQVVAVMDSSGIAKKVAKVLPMICIKG